MRTPGMLVPAAGGMVSSKLEQLARDVNAGLPIVGWAGDPDLDCRVGVYVEVREDGVKTGNQHGQFEIWFRPTQECIGVWQFEEIDTVIPDLVQMDTRNRTHTRVVDRIAKGNAAQERKVADQYNDSHGAMMDHLNSIVADTMQGPKTTFRGIPGRRDG